MKNISIITFYFSILVTANAQDPLSYSDLVERMYDLKYLAKPPANGELSGNFSSYDRQSQYNQETIRDEDNAILDW